jgi:hypothetical protein
MAPSPRPCSAAADTYADALRRLRPKVLLGLTATPERADGRSVLGWFDGRIAAEIRLWDALDLGLVSPFQYFGIHDGTDLGGLDFRAGRYDVGELERLYTADHVRANAVLRAIHEKVRDPRSMKALGFCVSVAHAEFMAAFCNSKGLPSVAVHHETSEQERREALQKLRIGELNVVFSKDLFNEGVDVPSVDTVLFSGRRNRRRSSSSSSAAGSDSRRGRRASRCSTSSAARTGGSGSWTGSARSCRARARRSDGRSRTASRICQRAVTSSSIRRVARRCSRTCARRSRRTGARWQRTWRTSATCACRCSSPTRISNSRISTRAPDDRSLRSSTLRDFVQTKSCHATTWGRAAVRRRAPRLGSP